MPYSAAVLPTRLLKVLVKLRYNFQPCNRTHSAISPRLAIRIDANGFEMLERYLFDAKEAA